VKIWITGASGSLGEQLIKRLRGVFPDEELIFPNRNSLDLMNSRDVEEFVKTNKPTHVYHLAAVVYGIAGHMEYPTNSLLQNTLIDHSVFSALLKYPPKWVYYSSSVAAYGHPYISKCLTEKDWLIGLPHISEYGYAMAKRHAKSYLDILHDVFGVRFVYGLTTNLFGSGDRFHDGRGHVIISLLKKGVKAKKNNSVLNVWGTENASRDFLATIDAASLLVDLIDSHADVVNIASGEEIFISEIAEAVTQLLNIEGGYEFTGQNEGIVRRVCSIEKLNNFSSMAKTINTKSRIRRAIMDFNSIGY
jgi:GDP-L-fucose synthase